MPKQLPLSHELRELIRLDIMRGLGRNAIARQRGVSGYSVTKIARTLDYTFPLEPMTRTATRCRRIDLAVTRLHREQELLTEQLTAIDQNRNRRIRKLEKKLIDLHRFHQPEDF